MNALNIKRHAAIAWCMETLHVTSSLLNDEEFVNWLKTYN